MRWDDAEWQPWRPDEAATRLESVSAPWAVAAGWAIDLFLGRERREHEDLEIAVPAERFAEVVPALSELELYVVGPATVEPLAQAGHLLDIHHQTWGLDRAADRWRIDVFRERSDGDQWVSRRDERIRLPYAEAVERSADGIPYVRPEIVLLFKAKAARPKDESDLAAVLPRLDRSRRRLLRGWIELAHPGHFWLADLDA